MTFWGYCPILTRRNWLGTGVFDVSRATQYGTAFGVTDLAQDGYTAGQLIGAAIDGNGVISARYSNGETRPAGQPEIATSSACSVRPTRSF